MRKCGHTDSHLALRVRADDRHGHAPPRNTDATTEFTMTAISCPLTRKVYFDITIGGGSSRRVALGLFGETAPKTTMNLLRAGHPQEWVRCRGSAFRRMISALMCQGGDFTSGDGRDGKSTYSEHS